ncbi:hypothetical protein [Fibrella arboris]|uniref:hypothetical protein n=1 Tax=Fibrella arboris TaxID=3242486 RepID=UPI0035204D78
MIPADDYFDTIEAYEENRLTRAQRHQFEQQLRSDPALNNALLDYRLFRHSLEAVKLKQQLNDLHHRLEDSGTLMQAPANPFAAPQSRPGLWRWVAAASVLLLLCFWAGWGVYTKKSADARSQAVFAAFYRPEPAIRGQTDCLADFTPVIGAYRAEEYGRALTLSQTRPANDPCTLYYQGLCLLALHRPARAVEALETARQMSRGPLQQRADWYLALAYLHNGAQEAGRRQLRLISQQSATHPFGNVARKALDQLDH